jgi:precorrin-6A synthase
VKQFGALSGEEASMKKVLVIGMGPGNADYVTMQAIKALGRTDVIFAVDKGSEKEMLNRVRTEICETYLAGRSFRFVTVRDPERNRTPADYRGTVEAWHRERADRYEQLIGDELGAHESGAFMVWGDPSLYDSTLRILGEILARGRVSFDVEVIPGVTAIQALAARHRVPLHGIGESFHVTTGRLLSEGEAHGQKNVVVMLDAGGSFQRVDQDDAEIYWGAYVGTAEEILVAGKLKDVASEIESKRREAKARVGWIMDTFILRRK